MYYDDEVGKVTPIDKKLLALYQKKRQLKEELRMLYVAATRAEDRLVMTVARKNVEAMLFTAAVKLESAEGEVNNDIYSVSGCYADWVVPCVLLHSDSDKLRKIAGYKWQGEKSAEPILSDIYSLKEFEDISTDFSYQSDIEAASAIKERLDYEYPYDILRKIEAKSSVSAIVHKAEEGDYDFTLRPGFLNKNGLTATDRGTAVHKIMQYMDFNKAREDFNSEIERLKEWEYISEEEAKVDTAHIKTFIKSQLFERMTAAKDMKREMKFLTFIPAKEINKDIPKALANEQIVVQGAVDCMFVEEGGIVIVDFKTDRVKEDSRLISSYAEQLNIYAAACEKITGLPVKEKIIYSLVLDRSIVV